MCMLHSQEKGRKSRRPRSFDEAVNDFNEFQISGIQRRKSKVSYVNIEKDPETGKVSTKHRKQYERKRKVQPVQLQCNKYFIWIERFHIYLYACHDHSFNCVFSCMKYLCRN